MHMSLYTSIMQGIGEVVSALQWLFALHHSSQGSFELDTSEENMQSNHVSTSDTCTLHARCFIFYAPCHVEKVEH